MSSKLLFISTLLGIFACNGCIADTPIVVVTQPVVSTKQAVFPEGTMFFKTDDGKDAPIAVGTTITIRLQEDTHGKFIWGILENNKSIFEVVKNVSELDNAQGGQSVQMRTFTMKATKPGKSNLKIVYFPAGLQDIAGATYTDTFRLNVKIIEQ